MRHRYVTVHNIKLHFVEAGEATNPPLVLLHGWPEDWFAYTQVITLAQDHAHITAFDLPGIGKSQAIPSGDKYTIARYIHDALAQLGLLNAVLVGHDIGGQVAYAYLKQYGHELSAAAVMDVAVPGIPPWDEVVSNPHIWHFAFHTIPKLPEKLVTRRQADYFDFFYNAISARPAAITPRARQRYAKAYSTRRALQTGFDWYRAFAQDAKDNLASLHKPVRTPLLYIRGQQEGGKITAYAAGFKKAGFSHVRTHLIPQSGHFTPEEHPAEVWRALAPLLKREVDNTTL